MKAACNERENEVGPDSVCDYLLKFPDEWEKCADECAKDSPAPECWRRYLKKKLSIDKQIRD